MVGAYEGEDWDVVARRAEEEAKIAASGGVEWYPLLGGREAVLKAKGHRRLWVCTHGRCGQAFQDFHFLRAHQLATK